MESSDGTVERKPVAYVYCRVSSPEQAQSGFSLQTQGVICRRYIRAHGWRIENDYQDIMSGTRADRRAYQQMLADARSAREQGQEVVVVVAALDRLGRKVIEWVRAREEMKALAIPLHSVREGGEVSDLIANILAAVAQEEARQASERVRAAKREFIANGWHPGGTPPWGYRWRPATEAERAAGAPRSVFEADPAAAPYVTALFRRIADGEAKKESFRWVASLPPEARGGFQLGYSNLRKRLLAPVYIARPHDGDPDVLRRPVGHWPALTDDETWERVRLRGLQPVRRSTGRFLLSGFITCSRCCARIAGQWRGTRKTAKYVCGRRGCRTYCGSATPLDTAVLGVLQELIEPIMPTAWDAHASFATAWTGLLRAPDRPKDQDRRSRLEGVMQQAHRRLEQASLLLVDGDLDAIGYEQVRERVEADLAAARARLADLTSPVCAPALPAIDTLRTQAKEWDEALCGGDVPAQRAVLEALVDHMVAQRVRPDVYNLAFTWTPLGNAVLAAAQGSTPNGSAGASKVGR